ncbi:hypothetical protein DFH06DRAFT_1470952 [Mycena polygramma]|nr:hypothetical protein DFH06DRAFT_1470952 [Mycena polygramma]
MALLCLYRKTSRKTLQDRKICKLVLKVLLILGLSWPSGTSRIVFGRFNAPCPWALQSWCRTNPSFVPVNIPRRPRSPLLSRDQFSHSQSNPSQPLRTFARIKMSTPEYPKSSSLARWRLWEMYVSPPLFPSQSFTQYVWT